MRLRLLLAFTLLSSSLAGCSSDEASSTGDTGADVDYGDGPITTRPDDGVDTGTAGDAAEETTTEETGGDASEETSGDTGAAMDTAMDTPAGDGGTPAQARINEIYVDRAVEGDKVEYIEISAPPGTPLDTLWLRAIDDKGVPIFELQVSDAGAKMNSKGLWVVASASFLGTVDKTHPLKDFGLSGAGGAVQLKTSGGTLIDVVGYGAAPATTATEPKKTIEGTAAAIPMSGATGQSIGRKSVPGDTDNNKNDFCVQTASAGAPNNTCLP